MPVYEYQCDACGQVCEYLQRMNDPDKTTCEACGGALARLISSGAVHFHGDGWTPAFSALARHKSGKRAGK